MKTINIKWPLAIVLLLLLFISFRNPPKITQTQAILLAETFIKDNGYTEAPADKSKIQYELLDRLIEGKSTIDTILKRRHNALHPKAYYFSEDKWGIDIGFLSSNVKVDTLYSNQWKTNLPGRAVIVSKDGSEVRIAHKDPIFSTWKRI